MTIVALILSNYHNTALMYQVMEQRAVEGRRKLKEALLSRSDI
mgnify:FL=1